MPTSHYAKDRAANRKSSYYNGLLMSGSQTDFETLLKKYAIYTGNDVQGAGNLGLAIGALHSVSVGPANANPALAGAGTNTITFNKMDKGHKVAWVNLKLSDRQQASTTARGDRLEMETTFSQTNGWVPAYFLPWSDLHSIRLTIPPKDRRLNKGEPDPDVFFTAAISGCSVIFQGTPQNPTIYHCGGPTGFGKHQLAETAAFWQGVVGEFIQMEQTQGNSKGLHINRGNVVSSVDKRDYVTDGTTATSMLGGVATPGMSTARAKKYAALLNKKHFLGKLSIEDVAPWGCVLGRRAANGDWTFYLQENADVIYHSVTRSIKSGFKANVSVTSTVSRPMIYREVFPAGARHVSLTAGLPRIL